MRFTALFSLVFALSSVSGALRGTHGRAIDVHSSSLTHQRSLKWPLVLPEPFAFPKNVADAARTASSSGSIDSFATGICNSFASKQDQGTLEFRDVDGAKVYAMFLNFARAAYVYPDTVGILSQVLQKCDSMGGAAAEGIGYSMAFVYGKGIVEAESLTKMLETVYDKSSSCSGISNILDIAAAVVKARDVAQDELHLAMKTWSPKLQTCTPTDDQQRFQASFAQSTPGYFKPRNARSGSRFASDIATIGLRPPGSGSGSNAAAAPPPSSKRSSSGPVKPLAAIGPAKLILAIERRVHVGGH